MYLICIPCPERDIRRKKSLNKGMFFDSNKPLNMGMLDEDDYEDVMNNNNNYYNDDFLGPQNNHIHNQDLEEACIPFKSNVQNRPLVPASCPRSNIT